MTESNGNGNDWMKWAIRLILATALLALGWTGRTMYAEMGKKVEVVEMKANLNTSAISDLKTKDATTRQALRMLTKKVDLLLREAGVPESRWPVEEVDDEG